MFFAIRRATSIRTPRWDKRMKGFENDLKGWADALFDWPQIKLINMIYTDFPP